MKSVSMKSKSTFSTIALVGVNNKAKHPSCDGGLALSEQVNINPSRHRSRAVAPLLF